MYVIRSIHLECPWALRDCSSLLLSCVQSLTADPRAGRANKGKVEALLEKEDRADSL